VGGGFGEAPLGGRGGDTALSGTKAGGWGFANYKKEGGEGDRL